jgi:hypothetical protein
MTQAYLKGFDEASSQHGCAECGIGGGHALYCVKCAEVALNTWVGLTDEEQSFIYDQVKQIVNSKPFWVRFADAIEAKIKEKNI